MLILLPPSEGKSAPASGPHLDLDALSFPSLRKSRRTVVNELIRMCRGDADEAAKVLGLGPTQQGEVGANTRVKKAPCAPAIEVYTGVLYEALDAGSLSPAATRRLDEHVAIASALWGLVRPSDPIPAYRLSGGVALPSLGPLSSIWRGDITPLLAASDDLIVDMRSGAYVSLGPIPEAVADRAVTVRVLTERNGKRSVVSHHNKATKGRLVRTLAQGRRTPRDTHGLMDALTQDGYRVELTPAARSAVPILDVIVESV